MSPLDEAVKAPSSRFWAGIALLASVVTGAASGLLFLPLLARIPNDLQRTRTILGALHAPPPDLRLVVFGDSVIMNGVDARHLQKAGATAMNLSSTSQTLAESLLYYQELPDTVTTVIQTVRLPMLVSRKPQRALNPDAANVFRVYGYEPSPETLELLAPSVLADSRTPLTEEFHQSAFRARWLFRQWVDTSARSLLRSDLDTARAAFDLEFPSPYTHPLAPAKLEVKLDRLRREDRCGRCAIRGEVVAAIAAVRAACVSKRRNFMLLIAPVHPALDDLYDERVHNELRQAIAAGRFGPPDTVIDASEALTAADFYDEAHPGGSGTLKLTKLLEQALNQR